MKVTQISQITQIIQCPPHALKNQLEIPNTP